jgi:histidyl-tRNA synthetase
MAKKLRADGKEVLIVNMKKNKKFQKEQLQEQGYTQMKEFYKDSVES